MFRHTTKSKTEIRLHHRALDGRKVIPIRSNSFVRQPKGMVFFMVPQENKMWLSHSVEPHQYTVLPGKLIISDKLINE